MRKPTVSFHLFEQIELRAAVVESAALAEGTRVPCRILVLDAGDLGRLQSVGQFALLSESELVGRSVVVVANLGVRKIGRYVSDALVLGTRHPDSPDGQAQAIPLLAGEGARPGDLVY